MAPNNIALSNTTNSTNNGLIPTKLYVTNFPFTCTQRQIQDLFSQFGQVVECTLKKDYYAYILFTSSKCALNAYKNANGYKMFGRKLTVHLATSKKSQSHLTAAAAAASSSSSSISPGPPVALSTSVPFFAPSLSGDLPPGDQIPRIVHVRNFPETCTQQQIRDVFSQYGDIVECLILHDSYAFVHFKSPVDARLALQNTNNKSFFSSTAPLLVQYSRSKFKQVQATPQQQQANSNVTSPSYQTPQMPTGECNAITGNCFTVPANRRPSNFRKPVINLFCYYLM
jgi:RNA recognition motif-containing protein